MTGTVADDMVDYCGERSWVDGLGEVVVKLHL